MKAKSTFTGQQGYELSGIGSAPEEDGLIVVSDARIQQLRKKEGFLKTLLSGPIELSGTGSDSNESDFTIQELVERGIRR